MDAESPALMSGGEKLVSNGGGEDMMDQQQEQLAKELKEEVAILGKNLEDLKLTNSV